MGNAKRRRKAAEPIAIPVTDGGPDITATDIFPTIDAMWLDMAKRPFLEDVSRERREMTKYAFYTAVAETLRTLTFRMNADQSMDVIDDFQKELLAYDRELQRQHSAAAN